MHGPFSLVDEIHYASGQDSTVSPVDAVEWVIERYFYTKAVNCSGESTL